jgi:FKBP-type peptidyl-prolyl cis-trans isomerase
MRRLTAAILALPTTSAVLTVSAALTVGVTLAGCSSSSSAANANESVKVAGVLGKEPTVKIPAARATGTLVTKTLAAGNGALLASTDSYLANFNVYVWHGTTHKLIYTTYTSAPQVLPVSLGLTGLEKAMTGARIGSRVLAVVPPKYGYGKAGQSQLGVGPTDTMVWVLDPLEAFTPTQTATGKQVSSGGGALPTVSAVSGQAPTLTIPIKKAPPSKLVVTTLIKGTGPAVKAGQTLVTRYIGSIWRTGKEFNNDWPTSAQPAAPPTSFPLNNVITAWKTGLVGIPVGSRVMLVVPPAEGYGKKGQPSAGIKSTDTLVFVIDILAAAGG